MKRTIQLNKVDEPLIELLNKASEDPAIQNLQWPSMRFVYCPEWVLSNVVRECCTTTTRCIFSIDTTYNIGQFYVTPTTYQMEDIEHKESGSARAHFPGPAMFHVKRTMRDFIYFSSTLCEINTEFSKLKFIGGDRDDAQRHFLNPLRAPLLLPCTKHIKDDILRTLNDLKIDSSMYIRDIFGSVNSGVQGLLDSDAAMYRSRLNELENKWDPRFMKYFRSNIERDMRIGMLSPLLNHLGIDRYYNNASESTNAKYKLKARAYVTTKKGTLCQKYLNLSFAEAVEVYKSLIDEHRIDLSMSMAKNGSYNLKGARAKLTANFNNLSNNEKRKRLAKLDSYYAVNKDVDISS